MTLLLLLLSSIALGQSNKLLEEEKENGKVTYRIYENRFEKYHQNGKLKSVAYGNGYDAGNGYIDFEGNGNYKKYFANGMMEEESKKSSHKTREVKSYFEDGTLKSITIFKHISEYSDYDNNKSYSSIEFEYSYKEYYNNGRIKKERKPINVGVRNAPADQECITYYENGSTQSKMLLKFGFILGYARFYHENGKLAEEGELKGETKLGTWKYYNKDGSLKNTTDYAVNIKYLESYNSISSDTRIIVWFFAYDKRNILNQIKNLNSILPKEFLKKHLTLLFVVYSQNQEEICKSLIEKNQENYEFGNNYFVSKDNFKNWTQNKVIATPFLITYKNMAPIEAAINPDISILKKMIEKVK